MRELNESMDGCHRSERRTLGDAFDELRRICEEEDYTLEIPPWQERPGAGLRRRAMQCTIDLKREEDGRWIAEVTDLPGVLTYGQTRDEAMAKVQALALRVLADRLEHGETPELLSVVFRAV